MTIAMTALPPPCTITCSYSKARSVTLACAGETISWTFDDQSFVKIRAGTGKSSTPIRAAHQALSCLKRSGDDKFQRFAGSTPLAIGVRGREIVLAEDGNGPSPLIAKITLSDSEAKRLQSFLQAAIRHQDAPGNRPRFGL